MINLLTFAVCATFVVISALHVYWTFGGGTGSAAAIPSVNGVAAFSPSRSATLAVAGLLLLAALAVLLVRTGWSAGLPAWSAKVPAMVVAVILAARAVGDFRLVGFFKQPSDSRFAVLDTLYFSPLCLALAASIIVIALAD